MFIKRILQDSFLSIKKYKFYNFSLKTQKSRLTGYSKYSKELISFFILLCRQFILAKNFHQNGCRIAFGPYFEQLVSYKYIVREHLARTLILVRSVGQSMIIIHVNDKCSQYETQFKINIDLAGENKSTLKIIYNWSHFCSTIKYNVS